MRILLGKTDKNNGKYENLVIDKNKIFLEKNDNKNYVVFIFLKNIEKKE